ncbi:MAG: hypothetical protein JOZ17_10920 [Acetobacteraceae bacterium]|nr:hypothetical protein [Acetobacteraceae bacterium]
MLSKFLPAVGLTFAIGLLPAAAQQSAPQTEPGGTVNAPGQQSGMSGDHGHMGIRQRIKQDLEQAGFTNVQVMPESFLVRAHDRQGRPVMMVINPDSVVGVTEMGGNAPSGSQGGNNPSGGTRPSGASSSSTSSRATKAE